MSRNGEAAILAALPPSSSSSSSSYDDGDTSDNSSEATVLFRPVDQAVVDQFHPWQSPVSLLAEELSGEAAQEVSEVYSQLEEWRDHVEPSHVAGDKDTKAADLVRQRRTAETRYAPGLSSFLSLHGRTGAENVRSSLITLPPISIAAAKALLDGKEVTLQMDDEDNARSVRIYSPDGSMLVDEPESDNAIDPLEFVVPWLPPHLLLNMSDTLLRQADQVYLGAQGGASLVTLPDGMQQHWNAWSKALLDPNHRVWRLAYVRLARVADRYNRPFCYQLVASSWREQYSLVMRMYTHVNVSLRYPLDDLRAESAYFKLHSLERDDNMYQVDSLTPNTLNVLYGLSLVIDTRSAPPVVNVSPRDHALMSLLRRMPDNTLVVRSMGAISFAVTLQLISTIQQVLVRRVNFQFEDLLDNARPNNALHDNEIELLWTLATAPPTRTRVGATVRLAMGEPDPRAFDSAMKMAHALGDDATIDAHMDQAANTVGRSRIQLYVVAPHEALPLRLENRPYVASMADHRRLVELLHQSIRQQAVAQYLLAPVLNESYAWAQYANQELWGEFAHYKALESADDAARAFDVNRAISVRVLFEAEQVVEAGNRDTCVLRPTMATAGVIGTAEERQRPLRTSLLFVGNSALRSSLTQDVSVHLLPSPCVRSYLTLYSNGLSNTDRTLGHTLRQFQANNAHAINTYLARTVGNPFADTSEHRRATVLLTRASGPDELPTLGAGEWGSQNEPEDVPGNDGPLVLVDDSLGQEIEHVRPWPANFDPSRDSANDAFSLMAQVMRGQQQDKTPNAQLHGNTSFYQDVRSSSNDDGKQHVRLGLWLDGLHPRVERMQGNMRAAVLVHDPHRVLVQHGIDTLRVMVFINYRDARGRRYTNAEPTTLVFALHHQGSTGEVVALPYAGDPLLRPSWLHEQALMVHGSTVETNAPGLMLSKKLGALRL